MIILSLHEILDFPCNFDRILVLTPWGFDADPLGVGCSPPPRGGMVAP